MHTAQCQCKQSACGHLLICQVAAECLGNNVDLRAPRVKITHPKAIEVKEQSTKKNNYVWRNFKPIPGEIYFSDQEIIEAKKIISDAKKFWYNNHNKKFRNIIFLETSSTKINDTQFSFKHQNKDWGIQNWISLINELKNDYLIIQSKHTQTKKIDGIFIPHELDFRLACALLKEVDFYVGPEGGFGHVAAALNKKAVLYFGGWISPDVIGYDFHENIYYEDKQSPCGVKLKPCNHCSKAREVITTDLFLEHIYKISSS